MKPNGRILPAHFFCLIHSQGPRSRTPKSDARRPSRAGSSAGAGVTARGRQRPDAAAKAQADAERPLSAAGALSQQATVERTVTGLGYELVDIEREARGLLRVTIDRLPGATYDEALGQGEFITVDDCERVTRQLQYALEVAAVNYARLEVSSPGLDRPLRTEAHFARFTGERVVVTLKAPFEGRKRFEGVLQPRDGGWRVEFTDGTVEKALDFTLDEVRETRLVPVVDFKGRRMRPQEPAAPPADGGHEE